MTCAEASKVVCELTLLEPPAPTFTKATALAWIRGERIEFSALLEQLAFVSIIERSTEPRGLAYAICYFASDLQLLVGAAAEAIASDSEISLRSPSGSEMTDHDRALYLAKLIEVQTAMVDDDIPPDAHRGLAKLTNMLVEVLDEARESAA